MSQSHEQNFSTRFRQEIDNRGWSNEEACKNLGISRSMYFLYLGGQIPKEPQLLKIAKRLGVSSEHLLEGDKSDDATLVKAALTIHNHTLEECQFMKELKHEWEYICMQSDQLHLERDINSFKHSLSVIMPSRDKQILKWLGYKEGKKTSVESPKRKKATG